MSVQLVVDMNLSPDWVSALAAHGWSAVHWSNVGDPRADDSEILRWASDNDQIVFTHDLDFGTILAVSHASGPSVLQVRCQNVLPEHIGPMVFAALRQHQAALESGAILVVDERRSRVRILPF
jgi:predicted nuclease of predicted toxin-antitoxin system